MAGAILVVACGIIGTPAYMFALLPKITNRANLVAKVSCVARVTLTLACNVVTGGGVDAGGALPAASLTIHACVAHMLTLGTQVSSFTHTNATV